MGFARLWVGAVVCQAVEKGRGGALGDDVGWGGPTGSFPFQMRLETTPLGNGGRLGSSKTLWLGQLLTQIFIPVCLKAPRSFHLNEAHLRRCRFACSTAKESQQDAAGFPGKGTRLVFVFLF